MSMYEELDRLIIEEIRRGRVVTQCIGPHWKAACGIARDSGRETYRVIDGRLQALRKAGKIKYLKASAGSKARWVVVDGGSEGGVDDRWRWIAPEGGSEGGDA